MLTDEQLLLRHASGDKTAMAELVSRYQKELFSFLKRFVNDQALAEDLFQETFILVHRNAANFDPHKRFRPWIFTIAANKARDYLRGSQRKTTQSLDKQTPFEGHQTYIDLLESDIATPEEGLSRIEDIANVQKILEELPSHYKEILLLNFFHHFTYKQMAEMLNIPLGTVKSRLHAAVASFAKAWKEREKS